MHFSSRLSSCSNTGQAAPAIVLSLSVHTSLLSICDVDMGTVRCLLWWRVIPLPVVAALIGFLMFPTILVTQGCLDVTLMKRLMRTFDFVWLFFNALLMAIGEIWQGAGGSDAFNDLGASIIFRCLLTSQPRM